MPTDDRYDPAAAYAERFGPVTPSRYGEGLHHPAEHDDRSTDDHAFDPWDARLRALDAALREHAAAAVERRARGKRTGPHGRAGRTRRRLDDTGA